MTEKQKSARSKKMYVPFVGLAVLLAVWSVYWWFGANVLKSKIEQQIAAFEAQGFQVQSTNMRVSGWPYRFALQLENLDITLPAHDGGAQISTQKLVLHAMVWKLSHIILELPNGSTYQISPDQKWTYTAKRTRASMVFKSKKLSRLSVEMISPVITKETGETEFSAQMLELHFRPGSQPDSRRIFMTSTTPNWKNSPVRELEELRLQAEIFSFPALLQDNSLTAFRDAAGQIELNEARLVSAGASVTFRGNLRIDQNGFAIGPLDATFTQPGKLLAQLDKQGFNKDAQKTVSTLSSLLGRVEKTDLSFRLKKGGIYSGFFRLARTPRLIEQTP